MKRGRASGPDGVPPDDLQATGPPMASLLAQLCAQAERTCIPQAWRRPAWSRSHARRAFPSAINTARGVVCAPAMGKVFSKALRPPAAAAIADCPGPVQSGANRGGGTLFPAVAVQCFLRLAARLRRPAAVLFVDIKAAFYSILPQLALPDLEEPPVANLGTASLQVLRDSRDRMQAHLNAAGVGRAWQRAAAD